MNYRNGDSVIVETRDDKHLVEYAYDEIPNELTNGNGSTELGENPDAKVEGEYNEYILVSYTDKNGSRPTLGILPKYLTPIFTSWKDRYNL